MTVSCPYEALDARRIAEKQAEIGGASDDVDYCESEFERCLSAIAKLSDGRMLDASTVNDIAALLDVALATIDADTATAPDALTCADLADARMPIVLALGSIRTMRAVETRHVYVVRDALEDFALPNLAKDLGAARSAYIATAELAAEFAADAWGDDAGVAA